MEINFITVIDVQKEMHTENQTVITKCKNCKDEQLIGNHIGWIKDYLKNPARCPLHKCRKCKAETQLEDPEKIKTILEIK